LKSDVSDKDACDSKDDIDAYREKVNSHDEKEINGTMVKP